ncbi:putative C-terminal domain small phosphatase [Nosema granulosis]|uniref:C-terminal domain small phosphatase n=1 Tax=Nosema granulosis TaxID=83296 RepID=A0A9P6L049_9MICR|nr:putative C-terminal domain small phosphatase [Nosema granulosis]
MGFFFDLFSCCSSNESNVKVDDINEEKVDLSSCQSLSAEHVGYKDNHIFDYLLPRKTDDLPTLVLDLDSTLVYSTYESTKDFDYRIFIERKDSTMAIFVKERPFLRRFLKQLSEKYEIVIFTASKEKYASQVISRLGGKKYIQHALFRESCSLVDGNYIKDLSRLGRDLERTIIVDDAAVAFSFHPRNGINIKPYFGQEDDTELKSLCNRLSDLSSHTNLVEQLEGYLEV